MRALMYLIIGALAGLVMLVLAYAMRADVTLAGAAQSVGLAALLGAYAFPGSVRVPPVVGVSAGVLGLVLQLSAIVAAIVLLVRLAIRLALQAVGGRRV